MLMGPYPSPFPRGHELMPILRRAGTGTRLLVALVVIGFLAVVVVLLGILLVGGVVREVMPEVLEKTLVFVGLRVVLIACTGAMLAPDVMRKKSWW